MEVSEGVLEFRDPFEFFDLPLVVQYEYLLKSDLQSIKNLCNAAALSSNPKAMSFFQELCNSYSFWKEKFRRDFLEVFEETSREAEEKGMEDRVGYWRGKYEEEIKKREEGLNKALKSGDIDTFSEYLRLGVDPNTLIEDRVRLVKEPPIRPVLTWASDRGYDEIVRKLLASGADVNAQDVQGITALQAGVFYPQIVEMLLEAGADPNIQDEVGGSALDHASGWMKRPEVVKMLLEAGADVNVRYFDADNSTPLITASEEGNTIIVKMLLDAGADVDAEGYEGETALSEASREGHLDAVRVLLEAGAGVNRDHLAAAIYQAGDREHTEIVELLEEEKRTPPSLAALSRRSLRGVGRGGEIPEYLQ